MSRAQVIISQQFLLLFMTQAKAKFLLVKTESNKIRERKMGEDYGMPPDFSFYSRNTCNTYCKVKCVQPFKSKSHRCLVGASPYPIQPKTKPRSTPAHNGCVGLPQDYIQNLMMKLRGRSRGVKQKPWGFYARGQGTGKSFCCTRGPRSGGLVRAQGRCKKAKKPRK